MAAGDVFRCRFQYTFDGERMENRYHLLQATGVLGASEIASQLAIDWIPDLRAVQSTGVLYTQIVVINLDDPTDFFTLGLGLAGLRIGDPCPSFVAWGFIFQTTNRLFRSGGCRIGGVSEADMDNGIANGPALGVLATLSAELAATLINAALTDSWNLVLHREPTDPPTLPELTVGISSTNYARVTTQSSRKTF